MPELHSPQYNTATGWAAVSNNNDIQEMYFLMWLPVILSLSNLTVFITDGVMEIQGYALWP
jgi:hypothetical protein